MRSLKPLAILMLCWLALAGAAEAGGRVALVIGNGDYAATAPLANPVNDAHDVAALLGTLGFDVVLGTDVDENDFSRKLAEFSNRLSGADVALFYYAGHGLQFDGQNYLIPVDAKLEDQFGVRRETLPLEEVLAEMDQAPVSLVFIDACRNNPFSDNLRQAMERGGGRSAAVGRGLARVDVSARDMLIAFAAGPGAIASDGMGRNSPFTSAILKHLATPSIEISTVLKRVTAEVRQETGGNQQPEQLTAMATEFYMVPDGAPVVAVPTPPVTAENEPLAFSAALSINTEAGWTAFLAKYPEGQFREIAEAARAKVASLAPETATPAPGPAPVPPKIETVREVKFGIMGDLTGPIESLSPPIVASAQLAFDNVNAQGGLLGGQIVTVVGDSACDPSVAGPSAGKLVNSDKVTGIVGPFCSGATMGAAMGAGIAGRAVIISPSASAPTLTDFADDDLVFRTAASDSFQGIKLAELVRSRGVVNAGVLYMNNDYGVGLSKAFADRFRQLGGTVTEAVFEEGQADYGNEVRSMTGAGADALVVFAYASSAGRMIVEAAIASGAFSSLFGSDAMLGDDLVGIGADGFTATRSAGARGESADMFARLANDAGMDAMATYGPEAYDAAFLLALAVQKNGSAARDGLPQALRAVSTAPGEIIRPGEWAKALSLLQQGYDIDYEGASGSVGFDEFGDVATAVAEVQLQNGRFVEVGLVP